MDLRKNLETMNLLIFMLLKIVFLASVARSHQEGFVLVAPKGCPHYTYAPVCGTDDVSYLNGNCLPKGVKLKSHDPCPMSGDFLEQAARCGCGKGK